MQRVKMLHQDKRHARVQRQMPEQFRERLQPARRGADTNNGE